MKERAETGRSGAESLAQLQKVLTRDATSALSISLTGLQLR